MLMGVGRTPSQPLWAEGRGLRNRAIENGAMHRPLLPRNRGQQLAQGSSCCAYAVLAMNPPLSDPPPLTPPLSPLYLLPLHIPYAFPQVLNSAEFISSLGLERAFTASRERVRRKGEGRGGKARSQVVRTRCKEKTSLTPNHTYRKAADTWKHSLCDLMQSEGKE